jgi:hypothetical protein
MKSNRFRIAKHLTSATLAVAMAGLLLLGFDGLLVAMHKLADVISPAPAPTAAPAPAPAEVKTPGVVQTFIMPAGKDAPADKKAAGP